MKLAHSIGSINNPIAAPPLDNITGNQPSAAWGLRKLSSSYTGAACSVVNSAGATSEVYFDNNNEVSLNSNTISGLTLQGFSALTADGNVFVDTWYDQTTGTIRNATQTTAAERPLLVEGTIAGGMRERAIRFIDDYFKVTGYRFPNPDDSCTILAVAKTKGGVFGVISDIEAYDDGVELIYNNADWSWRIKTSDLEENGISAYSTSLQLAIASYDTSLGSNQQTLRVNGSGFSKNCGEDKHVASTDRFRIGSRKTTDNQLNGWIGEGMVWESALSYHDTISLENNIFTHYKIPKGSVG